jgi:NAD+ diphosphatase
MAPAPERPNVFAAPHVDRLAVPRTDAAAIAAALASGRSRLVPVWRNRSLIVREPAPAAALLPLSPELRSMLPPAEPILLGEFAGTIAFAVELSTPEPPALAAGAEFVDLRLAAGLLDAREAGLLAYARAMVTWRAQHRFCGACGSELVAERAGHQMRCPREGCGAQWFPRLDPAIIVLVEHEGRALLGRQAAWPAGRYSTLAGFVEPGESLEDAVRREVLEETGVRVGAMTYHSSQPWPFPSSIMIGFHASAQTSDIALGDDELEDARWFSREEIAAGAAGLPPMQSVSWRLIEQWYDREAPRPLVEEPGVQRWTGRR